MKIFSIHFLYEQPPSSRITSNAPSTPAFAYQCTENPFVQPLTARRPFDNLQPVATNNFGLGPTPSWPLQSDPSAGSQPRFDPYIGAPIRRQHQQSLPVHKWPMRFSGDPIRSGNDLSIHEFLSHVSMYARTSGISEEDLVSQIMHLLSGQALSWYETVYQHIRTWQGFVNALQQKFLPEGYGYAVLNELENHKQKEGESVDAFISDMQRRLRAIPLAMAQDEHYATRTIRRNLLPYYRDALRPFDTTTMAKLERRCKLIAGSDGSPRLAAPTYKRPASHSSTRHRHRPNFVADVEASSPKLESIAEESSSEEENKEN